MIENTPFTRTFAQSFFLTIPLSIAYCLINLKELRLLLKTKSSLMLCGAILLPVIANFLIYYDIILSEPGPYLRQMSSFLFGIITYLSFLIFFPKSDLKKFSKIISIISIPLLIYGVIQFIEGKTFTIFPRISSLFTEPGHYADYIIWILIPAFSYNFLHSAKSPVRNIFKSATLILIILNIVFIQSNLFFLKTAVVLFLFVYYSQLSIRIKLYSITACFLVIAVASSFKNSYITAMLLNLYIILKSGKIDINQISIIDRFGPIYFEIINLFDHKLILGSSFAADWYLKPFPFSENIFSILQEIKPSKSIINAFLPKILLYFGFLPIALIIYFLIPSLKSKSFYSNYFKGILICSIFSMGNLSMPYIWVWLALFSKKRG